MEKVAQLESGINLSYQDTGKKGHPAIILIMGLGAQMTVWPDELYYGLVNKGFRVIRFDNRDTGKSSLLSHYGKPNVLKTWATRKFTSKAKAPYLLEDMVQDTLALMSYLKIKKAHLIGASMGGMIAQILAANNKKKVLSLTCLMSSARSQGLTVSRLRMFMQLANRPSSSNRKAAINYNVKLNRLIGSPSFPIDDKQLYQQAKFHIERGYHPDGISRQLAALTASGCRRHLLKSIKAKTLVIHGNQDLVIPVQDGIETAQSIKKNKLKIVDGMGHDFPPEITPKLIKWISKHILKAEKKSAAKKALKKATIELN